MSSCFFHFTDGSLHGFLSTVTSWLVVVFFCVCELWSLGREGPPLSSTGVLYSCLSLCRPPLCPHLSPSTSSILFPPSNSKPRPFPPPSQHHLVKSVLLLPLPVAQNWLRMTGSFLAAPIQRWPIGSRSWRRSWSKRGAFASRGSRSWETQPLAAYRYKRHRSCSCIRYDLAWENCVCVKDLLGEESF